MVGNSALTVSTNNHGANQYTEDTIRGTYMKAE